MAIAPKPTGYYQWENNPNDYYDLSIIVPVYNTANYLVKCLDSIVSQKSEYSYEIICIDDGSPDNSIDILNKYQKRYSFIKIIRQKNRGFSGARNRGIDEASGKYIMFVDSDDYLLDGIIQKLLNQAYQTKHDIISCGFVTFNEKGIIKNYIQATCNVDGYSHDYMKNYQSYFWGKVYRRDFWKNIRLPEGYYFEDMIVLHILSRKCCGYSNIEEALYAYRMNPKGITQTVNNDIKCIDQYWMVEYIEAEMERIGLNKDAEFYVGLLKELGPFLYNRTIGMKQEIRQLVFSAASDRVNSWNINGTLLCGSVKSLFDAFQRKDFYMWEIVSSTWY